MGYFIEYKIKAQNLVLPEELVVNRQFSCITRTILGPSGQNGNTPIRFEITSDIKTSQTAERCTEGPLDAILDYIAYSVGGFLGKATVGEIRLANPLARGEAVAKEGPLFTGPKELKLLENALTRETMPFDAYLRLYRQAWQVQNPITRYLFLYSLLAELKGPSPKSVDAFIQEEEAGVLLCRDPKDTSKQETVYTYYRKRVGLAQRNSDLRLIRSKIERLAPALALLVRKAIQEQLS